MFKTLKSRVLAVLVVWLALSHLAGLWLYARKHEEAAALLQDALIADRIALTARLLDGASTDERQRLVARLSSPLVKVKQVETSSVPSEGIEGTRPHHFEHLVALFLDRPTHDRLKTLHRPATRSESSQTLLATLSTSLDPEPHHLPAGTLDEITTSGFVTTEIGLTDGALVSFSTPLLSVNPFSLLTLWAPLGAMFLSVLLSGAWMMVRAMRPLMALSMAADRLGTNIHSPPLPETGAEEVKAASHAFNIMQERIQRLIEDRTAFTAALAHDIGTPITRLLLRLDDMPSSELKQKIASDIDQMQRMVKATLNFARGDFQAEPSERFDLVSLVQSVADDLADTGAQVQVAGLPRLAVVSKPVGLRRAIANISDNAVNYGGRASISVNTPQSKPGMFVVSVDDDGPGIPAHLHEEAFRPFRRLNETTAEDIEGTGLGLSVARSVARSLGGEVTLANRPSGGLHVELTLPLKT